MTASIWEPSVDLNITDTYTATDLLKVQSFTATAAQTLFDLTTFNYVPDTGSLLIFKQGLMLVSGVDFTETSTSSFTLTVGATVSDSVAAYGFVGIDASVVTPADESVTTAKLSSGFVLPVAKGGTGVATLAALLAALNAPDKAAANTYTKAQNVASVALTDAASIATDASLSNVFHVTLGGNRTLANPTNLVAGGTYIWKINQDGTGSRTLAFDTLFKFAGGTAPVASTPLNSIDVLSCAYDEGILCCSYAKAFA